MLNTGGETITSSLAALLPLRSRLGRVAGVGIPLDDGLMGVLASGHLALLLKARFTGLPVLTLNGLRIAGGDIMLDPDLAGVAPTVGENIIATSKIRNNFCYPLRIVIFQYCDSNIGLFSIAPHLVIALPTLRWQSCRS